MGPLAVIPAHSPQLESIARAILTGASRESGAAPPSLVVANSLDDLVPAIPAPYVFVGWRADIEESRRFAEQTLAELARTAANPRHVALFEASLRGSPSHSAAGSPEGAYVDEPNTRFLSTPSRFVIDREPGGEFTGFLELARARAWGAQVSLEWFSDPSRLSTERPRPDPSGNTAGSGGWCGATE